jgi:iron complex transport system ATP-binding protein
MKIQTQNIFFSHDSKNNIPAINNFNIQFEPGNFYSILGPNGSGKTTFLDLLTGYLKPDSGEILFDNTNINSFSKNQMAKKIALVSQDYYINFPFIVREVVTMGRRPYMGRFLSPDKEDIKIVNNIAEITQIQELMGRKVTCLSGGETQRVVFARALCQTTPILLLDEAFSNMDISHSINLLKNLKNQIKQKGIIVISVFHDINFASIWSDYMIFLKSGSIIASGEPEAVLTKDIIKQVYNIDAQIEFNKFCSANQVYFLTKQ